MVRLCCFATLLLGRFSLPAGLRWDEVSITGTPRPLSEKKRRIVVEPGNETDPYERAGHYDDWVSGIESRYLDLQSPVCVTEVGSSRQRCRLLSQRLCTSTSARLPRTDASLGECFAPRRTCAVVGSSAHLLNVSWGTVVDKHDLVIRVNAAPAGSLDPGSPHSSLAPHVGTRTDARFVNLFGELPDALVQGPPSCLFLQDPQVPEECGRHCREHPGLCNITCSDKSESVYCTSSTCDVSGMRCLTSSMVESDHSWGEHHVFLDNLHAGIVDQVVPHSTAGFKAVIYAMGICEHVSIIGFGPSCSGSIGGRYYQGDEHPVATSHHYEEELALLLRASAKGTRAIIPPEARAWITAKKVMVGLPQCVDKELASRLRHVFAGFGASVGVNLVSEAYGFAPGA